ncbi:MAG TPA: phage terminase large subunit [Micavibrio sp.]
MKQVDFKIFLILWNRMQGQTTPSVHLRMAQWLQASWQAGDTRLLLMAFRSCGKSTIVGLFAAWLFYNNPNLRILVLAAEGTLARRMVRNVRRIIERHPLTPGLKPDNPDQWAGERFTLNRTQELRDPSMMARGIEANLTGSRADFVICDDVEVPNTCDTAEKRRMLREILGELEYILVPGGSILYVGTPHHWFTIYADEPRSEIGETDIFLKDYARLKIPVLEHGHSVWPERFTPDDLARKKGQGLNRFRSQMMLEPVNIAEGRLNPSLLQRFSADLLYIKELNRLELGGRKLISCAAFWDPAFGGRDGSVLAIVYADETGALWLYRTIYLHAGGAEDEATHQARQVVEAARACHVPAVTVETNGLGKFLPQILRRELARARVPCAVVEHNSTRNKEQRILESFETIMAARLLYAHDSVFKTPFITEMQEWRPGKAGGHDDGLDAVASALALQPVRLRSEIFSGRQNWQGSSQGGITHNARTDFDV